MHFCERTQELVVSTREETLCYRADSMRLDFQLEKKD